MVNATFRPPQYASTPDTLTRQTIPNICSLVNSPSKSCHFTEPYLFDGPIDRTGRVQPALHHHKGVHGLGPHD